MSEPNIIMSTEGGMWVRQLHFLKAHDKHDGHLHSHDHVTLLAVGSLRVTCGNQTQDFNAPHIITISARQAHDLTALVDGTIAYCVATIEDVVKSAMKI
jgi:quercetin dioxygenase-like cupin family protein